MQVLNDPFKKKGSDYNKGKKRSIGVVDQSIRTAAALLRLKLSFNRVGNRNGGPLNQEMKIFNIIKVESFRHL